jgi:transposase
MAFLTLSALELAELQIFLHQTPLAKEYRRALAMLWLAEGESVDAVAVLLHVSRQTVYNWARRFQERRGLPLRARLYDAPRPGRPKSGHGDIDQLIAEVIDEDPRLLGYNCVVWTAPLLQRYLRQRCRLKVSRKTVSRTLGRLGMRWKRPRHQLALRPDTWRQSKGGSNAA